VKELDPAEADALIALLAVPDPPLPAGNLSGFELVRRFVEDSEIRPGRAAGIEVCSLYRLYKQWNSRLTPPVEPVRPMVFAHQLKQLGFRQRKRTGRFRHDKRLLGVRKRVRRAAAGMAPRQPGHGRGPRPVRPTSERKLELRPTQQNSKPEEIEPQVFQMKPLPTVKPTEKLPLVHLLTMVPAPEKGERFFSVVAVEMQGGPPCSHDD
jgi:hypothetical protein